MQVRAVFIALLAIAAAACSSSSGAEGGGAGGGGDHTTGGGAGDLGGGGGGSGDGSGGGAGNGGGDDAGAGGGHATGGGDDAGEGSETGGVNGFVFGAYKDTSIYLSSETNVITTTVPGSATRLADDLVAEDSHTISLAFATGECGMETWGSVQGDVMASANAPIFAEAGVDYILSTGGAAGSFSCGSDEGFATFVDRWASPHLVGVDFDIEAGQSDAVIQDLVRRVASGHERYPDLRFSFTLATLANNDGSTTAHSLGAEVQDSLNYYGWHTFDALESILGFDGTEATWPSYVTINLMVMDYGSASSGICVVNGGLCDMGQSAIQAAYNLHDARGVPYANIELTPMIGGNDISSERFTLEDVDTMTTWALENGLAGIHYWSYDRDVDCPTGAASPTCNSLGGAGAHGFLRRFLAHGLR
jgi:hypothetical protein